MVFFGFVQILVEHSVGHRPVIVKRAVIGSKGRWNLSAIFLSSKVFHDWSIIKLGNIFHLLDGYIFAVLFETISHCFCWLSLLVWPGKKDLAFLYFFFSRIFLSCRVPTFRGQKVYNMVVTGVSHSCLLIELVPICNSMAASLWLKSCDDHSPLKSYNGGLWKNNYRSGPCKRTMETMTPRTVLFGFSLNCLPMSNKKDARLIWVN